jgi:hypothetical protein
VATRTDPRPVGGSSRHVRSVAWWDVWLAWTGASVTGEVRRPRAGPAGRRLQLLPVQSPPHTGSLLGQRTDTTRERVVGVVLFTRTCVASRNVDCALVIIAASRLLQSHYVESTSISQDLLLLSFESPFACSRHLPSCSFPLFCADSKRTFC